MITGSFKSIPDAWISSLRGICTDGVLRPNEYGNRSLMVNGLLLEVVSPQQVWHHKDPFCTPNRVKYYVKQFKRENAGNHGFEYTYIDRLINYQGFDQLMYMRGQLEQGRFDSKRCQAITWIPEIDDKKFEDQPCFQRIWVYAYPDKSLEVHIHYRSWDMFKAFEANLMAFLELIHDEFTEPYGFKLGVLRCFADNVHIYESDLPVVKSILKG